MGNIKKILIIQTAFIGDIVLATSLIEKIRKFYLYYSIDFLLKKGNESVLLQHPYINEILIFDKSNKFKSLIDLIKRVRQKKYHIVVNINRHFSSGIISSLSKANKIVGFSCNPFSIFYTRKIKHNFGIHEIERNHLLISDITNEKHEMPKVYPTNKQKKTAEQFCVTNFITISPISIWFTKTYPLHKWLDFINSVDRKFTVYLLGSQKDFKSCEYLKENSTNKNLINLSGKLDLLETSVLFGKARMNYCLDSAPLHIASAVDAPVASIFCSTNTQFGYGPLSKMAFVVEVKQQLECRPCTNHGKNYCPLNHFDCANKILNEQLLNIIK